MNSEQDLSTCAKMGILSKIAASIKKKMRINRQENRKENKKKPTATTTTTTSSTSADASRKGKRKNYKNSLLMFPISLPRKAHAAYKSQPGVTNLHRACFQARPPSSIMSIMRSDKKRSANVPDFLGRLPLHLITIRICEGKMPLTDSCLGAVLLLSAEYLPGIFAQDDFGDTPVDIVHAAKLILREDLREEKVHKDQDAYRRRKRILHLLMIHLRLIGTYHYRQQKMTWESKRGESLFHDEANRISDFSSLAVLASERSVGGSSVDTYTSTDEEFSF